MPPFPFPNAAPWTCASCLRQQSLSRFGLQRNLSIKAASKTKKPPRPRRRRRLLVASTGATVAAGAVAFTDQGQHAATAVQRTGRVLSTLFVNINDYRITLKHDDADRDAYDALLRACHQRCAQRTLSTLEKNGSMFIKLGQHLSSLNYLLPREWCDTFIPLQDKCPVSAFNSIAAMVERDTGQPLDARFVHFDHEPLGAASLAQVHRAVERDTDRAVAVKVQHPALDEWVPLDLALTQFTFATLKRFFPDYDLTWLGDELQTSLPQELDFAREGANAERARDYFALHVDPPLPLVIPAVRWATRRVLVMEDVGGARPDDLAYLDAHHIDRDDVSAALARVFNEMIFGDGAPLHCDPHGGNLAVRHRPDRAAPHNFDIVLYDHGLYRDIPTNLRRGYARLWLAVLDGDESRMRRYAKEVAGVDDAAFPLFASAITGRDYSVLRQPSGVAGKRTSAERDAISGALGSEGAISALVSMLGSVPRVILLILKTNDLTRSLDESLHTRQGPIRSFLILARYAARCVLREDLEALGRRSMLRPANWLAAARAWAAYLRVRFKLSAYEWGIEARRWLRLEIAS